jgi:hypothetical protein
MGLMRSPRFSRRTAAIALALLLAGGSSALAARKPALPAAATPQGLTARNAPCPHCPDSLPPGATPQIQLSGRLERSGEDLVLDGCFGRVTLEGMVGESVQPLVGHEAWINGACTGHGRVAALGGHALGDSTLDVFVMALCPFGRALEKQMAAEILGDTVSLPKVRVHWILYSLDDEKGQLIYARHGDPELRETVVQAAVRELEPAKFWPYVAGRAESDTVAWTAIADKVGLSAATRTEVQRRLDQELHDRARNEWQSLAVDWPPVHDSPTIFWLGRTVPDIAQVPGFGATKMPKEKCTY